MGILCGTYCCFFERMLFTNPIPPTLRNKQKISHIKNQPILTSLTNNCWFIEKDKTSKMFDISKKLNSLSENPDFDGLDLGFSVGAAVQVQQRQAAKTKQHFENIQVHCF